ncbi:MAG TPA: hypothetical protein DCY79_02770 [Planctomycetaceae bacterium]|nr:hypothetical protein [Blastopirellula sp.]HAY78713.1 hypothetical protein [Planctomycetaceae bacterium]|tara:strand:+ start:417 stop:1145 length:729 start_codon:yes stop_codon:yes gene_type:complete
MYHDHYGAYPPAYIADENGTPMHSWRVLILPFLHHRRLYDRYDFSQPWNSKANMRLATEMPEVYAFHGEYEEGVVTTNYLAVVGESTFWPGAMSRRSAEITDEEDTTIMLAENWGQHIHWMEPRDLDLETMSLEVDDPQGISSKYLAPAVVMMDSQVVKLRPDLRRDALRALLTVNGGEPLLVKDHGYLLDDGRDREERPAEETLSHEQPVGEIGTIKQLLDDPSAEEERTEERSADADAQD